MSRAYLHFVKKFFLLEILVVSRPYVTEVAIVVIERYQTPHYNHHRPFLVVRAGAGWWWSERKYISCRIWRGSRSLSSFSIPWSQVTWLLPPLPPRATRCARWSGRGVPHPHFIVTFRLSPIYWAAPAAKYNQWPSRASRSPQVHNWEQNVFWKPFSCQRLIRSWFQ